MLQKEGNLFLERNSLQQQSNTSLPAAPVSSEVKVTIMTDTAEEVGIATAAVPLSYSQLYGIVEEKAQLTIQEFELRLHMDSRALGTDWSWPYSSPLTIYVGPHSRCSVHRLR
jgi:hypothetical protein